MATPANILAFKKFTLDAIAYTSITTPINCNSVVLWNTDTSINMTLRSDSTDSATEKLLEAGVQEVIAYPDNHRYRFNANDIVAYAIAASGAPVLQASYSL